MQHRPFTYLFWIQYLGFRYHGWQKQSGLKTVQGKLEKTAKFVLGHEDFMTLGASRTDAGVSCNRGAFELFNINSLDIEIFVKEMNRFLPSDIKILSGQSVSNEFNIIQDVLAKEYHYYFSCSQNFHPFAAGNISHIKMALDIDLMQKGAQLFKGKHNFSRFCTKNKSTENFVREIFESELIADSPFKDGFYPKDINCFRVKGNGFLMHQVRFMMGALLELGQQKIRLSDITDALNNPNEIVLSAKALSNGLVLEHVIFKG